MKTSTIFGHYLSHWTSLYSLLVFFFGFFFFLESGAYIVVIYQVVETVGDKSLSYAT